MRPLEDRQHLALVAGRRLEMLALAVGSGEVAEQPALGGRLRVVEEGQVRRLGHAVLAGDQQGEYEAVEDLPDGVRILEFEVPGDVHALRFRMANPFSADGNLPEVIRDGDVRR